MEELCCAEAEVEVRRVMEQRLASQEERTVNLSSQ
jgi:hypothetical protein